MIMIFISLFMNLSNAKNICVLADYIDQFSTQNTLNCLEGASSLIIDSGGGESDYADKIMDFVNKNKIRVVCLDCSSMAAYIWLNSDYRILTKNSNLMIHSLSLGTPCNSNLKIKDLRNHADRLEKRTHSYFNKQTEKDKALLIKKMSEVGDFKFNHKFLKENTSIKFEYIGE